MKIKTSELFCSSPASTAICTTINRHAMVRRSIGSTQKQSNHNNNHYQFDFKDKAPKLKPPSFIPCTSNQHIDPKPYFQKTTKTAAKNTTRRKSSADINDRDSSSRYLLNNPIFVKDFEDSSALVVSEPLWTDDVTVNKKCVTLRPSQGGDSSALVKSRSSEIRLHTAVESSGSKSLRSCSRNQVVELRVSIHCKGCEGKVRKHISRMEGVKSFHIDLESKKVTVIGDISPLSVLASISKVKNAQLWPSPSPTSSSSSPIIGIEY